MSKLEENRIKEIVFDCVLDVMKHVKTFNSIDSMLYGRKPHFGWIPTEEEHQEEQTGRAKGDAIAHLNKTLNSAIEYRIKKVEEKELELDKLVTRAAEEYVKSEEFLDGIAERFKKKQL